MNITHTYDAPSGDEKVVEVTFECDEPDVTHIRTINAVFDADGDYNAGLTEERVVEVGLGVKNKIAVGAISTQEEE
tara:strand:+ start:70 stop:297 length:228 start_codon:yes stop_codon:yes gene_type:complete